MTTITIKNFNYRWNSDTLLQAFNYIDERVKTGRTIKINHELKTLQFRADADKVRKIKAIVKHLFKVVIVL